MKDRKTLKSLYRKLSFENHPDRGGDAENMKIINSLYEEFFKKLKELSCFWSKSKKMWYWNGDEEKRNIRTHSKYDDLKDKYGCVNIKTEEKHLIENK